MSKARTARKWTWLIPRPWMERYEAKAEAAAMREDRQCRENHSAALQSTTQGYLHKQGQDHEKTGERL